MVIFELVGINRLSDDFGSAERDVLLVELGNRLCVTVGASGACYRLRGSEFCVLLDDLVADRTVVLQSLVAALEVSVGALEIGAVFGAVVLPDEAADTCTALELADQRLEVQRRGRGVEPQALFGAATDAELQPPKAVGRGVAAFFRGYDNVSSDHSRRAEESAIEIGDVVRCRGSRWTVRGFSPLGVSTKSVELEDLETRKVVVVALDEVESDRPRDHAVVRLIGSSARGRAAPGR